MDFPRNDDETHGFTVYWKIEKFNCEQFKNFSLRSEEFEIERLYSKWQIRIGTTKDGYLSTFLFKMTSPGPYYFHYNVSALTSSGWDTIVEKGRKKFTISGAGHGGDIVNLEMLKRNKWFYLPFGSLTVSFRIWNDSIKTESSQQVIISRLMDGNYLRHGPIQRFSTLKPRDFFSFPLSFEFDLAYKETKEVKSQHTQTDSTSFNFKDQDDLRRMFKEKDFSFVTLRTPTKEFSLHKAVLRARSPVFNVMFERKMQESVSNVVDIDDIDCQTLSLFVKFLHLEPLGDLKWHSVISLYDVADKYQIVSLKEQCVSLLKKGLSIENVCDAFLLADLYEDNDLMNYAQEYFCQHSKDILLSRRWKEISGYPNIVEKILCKFAETMS